RATEQGAEKLSLEGSLPSASRVFAAGVKNSPRRAASSRRLFLRPRFCNRSTPCVSHRMISAGTTAQSSADSAVGLLVGRQPKTGLRRNRPHPCTLSVRLSGLSEAIGPTWSATLVLAF